MTAEALWKDLAFIATVAGSFHAFGEVLDETGTAVSKA